MRAGLTRARDRRKSRKKSEKREKFFGPILPSKGTKTVTGVDCSLRVQRDIPR